MFSIFHGLFTLLAIGINKANIKSDNNSNRERAKINGNLTYYGSRGNEYLVENNKWVSTKRNKQGETVIADMKTGQIYYNVSAKEKELKEKELKKQGKTVRTRMSYEIKSVKFKDFKQSYFLVDIETQNPVAIITINGVCFYISLTDGKILRPIDDYTIENKVGNWSVSELINIINERQNNIKKKEMLNDYIWVKNNFFFNNQYVYIDRNKYIHINKFPDWKLIELDGGLIKQGID